MARPPAVREAFVRLKWLLENWADEYKVCAYPEALARDASQYIWDQLLEARGDLDDGEEDSV